MWKIPQETEITISRKSGKFSMEIPQIVFLFNFHFDEKNGLCGDDDIRDGMSLKSCWGDVRSR